MTKEEAIIAAFVNMLKTIKPANEYEAGKNYVNDFSGCVYDWDDKPVPDEDAKQVIVQDGLIECDEKDNEEYLLYQTIEFKVLIYLAAGANTISNLRKADIDIIHCIGKNERSFIMNYDMTFVLVKREKVLDKKNKTLGASRITVRGKYNTTRWMIGEASFN